VLHDRTLQGNVKSNDSDEDVEDREHLTVRLIPGPQHAKTNPDGSMAFQVREDGSFTYTPAPSYLGSDTFVYAFSDGVTADIVTITVEVYNTAPEVSGATFRVLHNLRLSGLGSGNEVDQKRLPP
jgi:hypothetical protein